MSIDSKGTFEITAANDVIKLSYDGGSNTNIDCDDGTYEGSELATELQSKIDAAFSISSTVAYSSTTYKFTVTVAAGHTIAYEHTGSDMGLTVGFSEDQAAAVSITSDTAVPGDPSELVETILNGVDQWVNEWCGLDFDETTYTNELYDGTGHAILYLRNYPIISIAQISISRLTAIKVKNTSTDASNAYVSIDSDSVDLVVSGGDNAGTNSLALATYTTLADIVTAIDALGGGWDAAICSSNYNDILSSQLIKCQAKFCGGRGNSTAAYEYLEIPDDPISDFEFDVDNGEVYYSGGFSRGRNNVLVTYSAGYSSSDMPHDLKMAVMMSVQYLYQKTKEGGIGLSNYSLGHLNIKYADILPPEALEIFNKYKKPIA